MSGFFSPANSKKATWGIGPAFALPGTTDPYLGSGKWSIGPTAVVLKQSGGWTVGGLVRSRSASVVVAAYSSCGLKADLNGSCE